MRFSVVVVSAAAATAAASGRRRRSLYGGAATNLLLLLLLLLHLTASVYLGVDGQLDQVDRPFDIQATKNGRHRSRFDASATASRGRSYEDFFRRHLTTVTAMTVTGDGFEGDNADRDQVAATNVVVATTRSRMPYGLTKAGLMDIRKANEHYLKVHTEARCRDPRPRVVRVDEFYPDPSKEYLPSCTVLHHCSDDTGCCDSDTMRCVAKRQQVVELNFYKLYVSGGGIGVGVGVSGSDTVEKLSFVNDTECECQTVDDRPRMHVRKTMCLQCPSDFTLREQPAGTCACDCFDKQKSCLRLKRGRDVLAETDRRCVEARRCHQPDCEYGIYDSTRGRCPRKNERQSAVGGRHDGHHWWKFDERD